MIRTLGIDLGKNLCSAAGLDASSAIVIRRHVRRDRVLAFTTGLKPCIVTLLTDMAAEWAAIDRRITAFDEELATFAKNDGRARRPVSILGIGPLIASALAAAVGEARSLRTRTRFGGLTRPRAAAGDGLRSTQGA